MDLSPQQFGDYTIGYAGHRDESGNTGMHRVEASYEGKPVGSVEWRTGGKVAGRLNLIHVRGEHQRKGLATAMWRYAQNSGLSPAPEHSPERTNSGDAWAKSTGDKLPRRRKQ